MNKTDSEILAEAIEDLGIDKLIFFVELRPLRGCPGMVYTSSNDNPVEVETKISDEIYDPINQYKVDLVSIEVGFGKKCFYWSDLIQLIQDGHVRVFPENSEAIEEYRQEKAGVEKTWLEKILDLFKQDRGIFSDPEIVQQ